MTEADVYRFVSECRLGVLASIAVDGTPQSALVGIAVTPELEIVFDTVKTSRKYPNLMARPSCSFVIGWAGERTVQYEGEAEELWAPDLEHYQEVYFHAWPECQAHMSWPAITYFVVRPRWVRYSDFNQNPPLIQEFRFFRFASPR
jgi:pyridoxine/pyridoxamine 5'-phosphate oxidase